MNNILVIDDDVKRRDIISTRVLEAVGASVDIAGSFKEAKKMLSKKYYSVVFLDMALPLFRDSTSIDEDAGVNLLSEMSRGRLKTPSRVIGFTALERDVTDMEAQFDSLGFKLYVAKAGDFSWLGNALKQVRYTIDSSSSFEATARDMAVVTVHGILTFGGWQEELFSKIQSTHRGQEISHLGFKYARFDLLRFLFPLSRRKVVNRFTRELKSWMETNSTKRIVCFSHSFGTYVLVNALESFEDELLSSIDLVVLSGSVLKQSRTFDKLRKTKKLRIVNDCAVHDSALLFGNSFAIDTGMAGKVGFSCLSDDHFVNRFFDGGHSMFFSDSTDFIEKYWLPLLDSSIKLSSLNISSEYRKRDSILELFARISCQLKYVYYLFAASSLFMGIRLLT